MKPKIISYRKLPKEVQQFLEDHCEVCDIPNPSAENEQFLAELKEAKGLIGAGLQVDQDLLRHAPNLKIVSNISVGYNNLDIEALTKKGIMATNTPDVLNDTTADLVFGLLMATARRIAELHHYVKSGTWTAGIGEDLFGVDIHHKTLGIIGMGRIGTAIAKRGHLGFDMDILYTNRSVNQLAESTYNAQKCDLDQLLAKSDFVCLMTPLTTETEHLIGRREFSLMKSTAIFINGSRGGTVDEQALIEALEQNMILGAGLDVFQNEPLDLHHPFLKMNNVVTTPHIGSATHETRTKMAWLAAENLVEGLRGDRPRSLIRDKF